MVFNKENYDISITVNLGGSSSTFNTNGNINLYGFDKNNRLASAGAVQNKPSSSSFTLDMPAWSVRLAIINA